MCVAVPDIVAIGASDSESHYARLLKKTGLVYDVTARRPHRDLKVFLTCVAFHSLLMLLMLTVVCRESVEGCVAGSEDFAV